MKIIRISTDDEMTIHDFPDGSIREQNAFIRKLIGDDCDRYEHVLPRRLYNELHAVQSGADVDGVTKILFDSGIRDTEWKARRLALTEVLRMESMGQQDSFIQNPSCYKKRWVYTWQAKDQRAHHISMNGQEVFKREAFTLSGPNGTFHPMYPRDS